MKAKEFDLLNEILLKKKADPNHIALRNGSVIKADSLDFSPSQPIKEIHRPQKPDSIQPSADPKLEHHIHQSRESRQELPRIEVIRDDKQIECLLVYCRCGEIIWIEFDHP